MQILKQFQTSIRQKNEDIVMKTWKMCLKKTETWNTLIYFLIFWHFWHSNFLLCGEPTVYWEATFISKPKVESYLIVVITIFVSRPPPRTFKIFTLWRRGGGGDGGVWQHNNSAKNISINTFNISYCMQS